MAGQRGQDGWVRDCLAGNMDSNKQASEDLLKLINKFGKVEAYVNTQKSVAFPYTMNNLKKRLRKQFHL